MVAFLPSAIPLEVGSYPSVGILDDRSVFPSSSLGRPQPPTDRTRGSSGAKLGSDVGRHHAVCRADRAHARVASGVPTGSGLMADAG